MTVVVGYGPEARGNGGLELARMFAESSGLPLVVCCVIPDRWQPISSARRNDAEYDQYLSRMADEALLAAKAVLQGSDCQVSYEVETARSGPAGLLAAAEKHGARILVTGSSADGSWGHIALGSVTDRLLHSSPVPVALAPRGHRYTPGRRVERITVALDGTANSQTVLERATSVANDVGARLRVVTFAVRAGTMYPPDLGLHTEDKVVAVWREDARAVINKALAELAVEPDATAEVVVAEGRSWADALDEPDWDAGDVLVIGSSSSQPILSRVFLGSTAARIIRHSPVPVVVVP